MNGNWIDLLIIGFIFFYVWEGWKRGFIRLTMELIAFVGAFLLALKVYPYVARFLVSQFSLPQGIANAAAFLLSGLGLEQLLAILLAHAEAKIPPKYHKHTFNYWLSLLPLLGTSLIIVAFLLTLLLGLPIRPELKTTISESALAQSIISRTQRLEKNLSAIFGEAIGDTFNFITINPVSDDEVQLNFTQKNVMIDDESERQMLVLMNRERANWGLEALVMDQELRDLAREYAQDMFARGFFSHYNPEGESPFERMDRSEIEYRAAGENLAIAPTLRVAHQGLMDSPGHRANILSADFGRVGIGVMDGGIYGKMFVQEFTD